MKNILKKLFIAYTFHADVYVLHCKQAVIKSLYKQSELDKIKLCFVKSKFSNFKNDFKDLRCPGDFALPLSCLLNKISALRNYFMFVHFNEDIEFASILVLLNFLAVHCYWTMILLQVVTELLVR